MPIQRERRRSVLLNIKKCILNQTFKCIFFPLREKKLSQSKYPQNLVCLGLFIPNRSGISGEPRRAGCQVFSLGGPKVSTQTPHEAQQAWKICGSELFCILQSWHHLSPVSFCPLSVCCKTYLWIWLLVLASTVLCSSRFIQIKLYMNICIQYICVSYTRTHIVYIPWWGTVNWQNVPYPVCFQCLGNWNSRILKWYETEISPV